ncbi:rCG44185 [Rattus norvegicus]|uniref:RCG44185 n=1 Tax=Rattus norvegicus TaxID=10116 RepID=A6J755_RAT|nr:rCG44185 [Rattus norvegicus]
MVKQRVDSLSLKLCTFYMSARARLLLELQGNAGTNGAETEGRSSRGCPTWESISPAERRQT